VVLSSPFFLKVGCVRPKRGCLAYYAFPRWYEFGERRWNDIDSWKPKNSEKNLSQCHCVHHKSHMDWPGPPRERPATNDLSHGTALFSSSTSDFPIILAGESATENTLILEIIALRVSLPGRGDEFLKAIKIRSTSSFGWEVKPKVPCREILRHVKDPLTYERCWIRKVLIPPTRSTCLCG
jgi:hypothetical protein